MKALLRLLTVLLLVLSAQGRDEYFRKWFYRNYVELTDVPDDIPDETEGVYINNNNITAIRAGAFSNLQDCTFISLGMNFITDIEPGGFQGLHSITDLILFRNFIPALTPGMFRGLDTLRYLVLSNNSITEIQDGALEGLHNLQKLYMYGNKFTHLTYKMFSGLDSMDEIILSYNRIHSIEPGTFHDLHNLTELWMDNNAFTEIKKNSFIGMYKMELLHLNYNNISNIEHGTFHPMNKSLKKLWLDTNNLTDVTGLFTGLVNIDKIDLDINALTEIHPDTFYGLDKLTEVWFYTNQLTTLSVDTFTGLPRPLDLTLGDNPIECDKSLCWVKRGEKEGWLRWIPYEDRPLEPQCRNGVDWYSLELDCPHEVECHDPGDIAHGSRGESHWPYTPTSTISYTCQPCYTGGGTITCQNNGTWSNKPVCTPVTCGDHGDIANAIRVPSDDRIRCGKHVTYICNHGYKLHGNASLFCQPDGKFSNTAPFCQEMPQIQSLFSSSESATQSTAHGDWKYIIIVFGIVIFVVIVIVIIAVVLRKKGIYPCYREPRPVRMTEDLNPSNDIGAAGVTAVYDARCYDNKAGLDESGVSFEELKEKEGADGDYSPELEVPASPMASPFHPTGSAPSTPGSAPVSPPLYHIPEPPPLYTRHPSEGENQTD